MPSGSLYSPARIVLFVETIVSHATLASGYFFMSRSTIVSDILSHILSGCPSETDSEVNRYELVNLHSLIIHIFSIYYN